MPVPCRVLDGADPSELNAFVLRTCVFYFMFYLRRPFLFMGNIFIVGYALLGILVLAFGEGTLLSVACFFVSFVCFIVKHFYDTILLKLNPTETELTFHQ